MEKQTEHKNRPQHQVMDVSVPPQSGQDSTLTSVPPPPYTEPQNTIHSRIFWRNYTKDQNVYCATECCVRTCCLPCFCTSCIGASPCFCVASALHCCGMVWNCKYRKPTEEDLCWCCCAYNYLDKNAHNWAVGTVGCIKFPETRTEEEQRYVNDCNRCVRNIICCPCNACEWMCNLSCVKFISDACVNLNRSCQTCMTGSWNCLGLVGRRLCCMRPQGYVSTVPTREVMN